MIRKFYDADAVKNLPTGDLNAINDLATFAKRCFYRGFEKCDKDDANCFTAWREEAADLLATQSIEKTWWQKLGIKFDGKWYTHPKTNTYDNLDQVVVELNGLREATEEISEKEIVALQIHGLVRLLKFADCPQFLIDNPSLLNWRDGSEVDMEWAKKKVEKYRTEGNFVVRSINTNIWYWCKCEQCGWEDSSEYCDGGHAIADTGDYTDPLCPVCGSKDIDGEPTVEVPDDYGMHLIKIPLSTFLRPYQNAIKNLYESYDKIYWDDRQLKEENDRLKSDNEALEIIHKAYKHLTTLPSEVKDVDDILRESGVDINFLKKQFQYDEVCQAINAAKTLNK